MKNRANSLPSTPSKHPNQPWLRPAILAGILGLLVGVGHVIPIGAWLQASSSELRDAGIPGMLLFVLSYSAGALLFVPSAMFTFVAGFTYGGLWGSLIGVPGIATSALSVFLLSRGLLRRNVEVWLARDPRFLVLDRLLARFGARAVILLRLSPLSPFSVLNYAFGLTGIPKGKYFLATCAGTIPGSVFYAQLGAVAPHLGSIAQGRLPEGGRAQTCFLLLGILITAGVGIWLGRLAKQALANAEEPRVE